MNFVKFVDFKALPFMTYLDTLVAMSPLPTEGELDANFYFDARGFESIGHFDEVYPEHCTEYNYERFWVLENEQGERLMIFDGQSWSGTIDVVCDPRDPKALQAFIDEYHAEGLRRDQALKDYQDRCAKQVAGTSTATDLKEYDVHFEFEGRCRTTALSADDAYEIVNSRLNMNTHKLEAITGGSFAPGNKVTQVIDIFRKVADKTS